MQNQILGGGSLSRVASPSTQGTLSPSERMAESILSLLDEPDGNDKRWRAPIFRQLPKRFARIVAHDYKETYIFDGRQSANHGLLNAYGSITKNSIGTYCYSCRLNKPQE
ncbi:MAG: hypothetical protein Q7T48_11385 [Cellvibrio sp.]|uniref:hypothetical protein n=1 Tax=Cellvibrio sp. TaxID=1965322 RepID=UPI0027197150|nr:hypothetical protein [Cellvibrio sp.]